MNVKNSKFNVYQLPEFMVAVLLILLFYFLSCNKSENFTLPSISPPSWWLPENKYDSDFWKTPLYHLGLNEGNSYKFWRGQKYFHTFDFNHFPEKLKLHK